MAAMPPDLILTCCHISPNYHVSPLPLPKPAHAPEASSATLFSLSSRAKLRGLEPRLAKPEQRLRLRQPLLPQARR